VTSLGFDSIHAQQHRLEVIFFQSPSLGAAPIELARSTEGSDYFAKDLVALRATARFDLAVANPLGLCIVSGITVA
jgi:hypothetical protein